MKTKYSFKTIGILIFCFSIVGCKDFVDIELPNSMIVDEIVFENDETAISAVQGLYYGLFNANNFASGGPNSVTVISGLVADEIESGFTTSDTDIEFNQNDITINNSGNGYLWSSAYNTIYMANAILEGLATSKGVTEEVKKQLQGEALFIRAFTLFHLVNLYGNVPLVFTTDYRENALISRTSETEVYTQIITDLEEARGFLSIAYIGEDRTRPNYYTATALLARVYLYIEEWEKAETMAEEVIGATEIYELSDDINLVFLKNSHEAIWQIKPVLAGSTKEGNLFIIESSSPRFKLRNALVNSFEDEDLRLMNWIGTYTNDENQPIFYYPFKYKVKLSTGTPLEYSVVLRYAEQFLIRAEARAQQEKLDEAIADLDKIRERAGIPFIVDVQPEITKSTLLDTILQERRKEFFTEWGHRWLDLKRTNTADAVLGTLKPTWQATDILFPIPETEITKNPNLKPNNDGY
ncbi:RagB/SusD family nutrient uptake outer membrane protein [Sinomicrobium sp. M5D2P17]